MGKGADLTLLDCFQRTKNEDGEFNEMASLKVTRIIISFQKYSFIEVCSVAITFFDFKRNHNGRGSFIRSESKDSCVESIFLYFVQSIWIRNVWV